MKNGRWWTRHNSRCHEYARAGTALLWSIFIALLAALLPGTAQAELRVPVSGKVELNRQWALLLDPQDKLAVEQMTQPDIAAAFRVQNTQPALGYRQGSAWLRITLLRPANASPQWLLQLNSALLDDVTLYTPEPGGGYRAHVAGDRHPVEGRDISHRTPVFLLNLPAEQPVTVYVRVRSTSTMSFPMVLWSPDAFISFIDGELLLFGLFYAAHLVLLITSGWFYWVTRNSSFGLFCLTVLANLLTSLGAEGFTYQYLLSNWPLFNDGLYVVSWFCAVPLGALFMAHYLGLFESSLRRWAIGFSLTTWVVALASAPWLLFDNVWWIRPLYLLWQALIIGALMAVAGWMTWHGHKTARVLLLVLFLLLGGTALRLARNDGWIAPGLFVDNANYIGMVAFLLIMNSAITWRYTDLRSEKEAAQAEALRVTRQAERDLETKVALRTQELREAMAQVEGALSLERRAQEEQRQFLATVSHELRTPLAVIDATAQNLDLDDPHADPLTTARYQKILRATQRLTVLLNDSLHEDGFELLRHSSHAAPTDLAILMKDAAAAASLLSEGHRLEVETQDLDEAFMCDASLLRLVLRTLADNAVKYTPRGTRIVLRGKRLSDGVELQVEDDGPGIGPADLPHVFERFYRGQNVGQKPGTGLGLPLARRMVEMQEGSLRLDSTPGRGCRVTIFLPAIAAGSQANEIGSAKA
ncbi:sensor histidine kinase [Ralstonia sp. ASV6]|uniref:sensor histidine kinase n=1 Tax=Ralstonia sp. ASV6 TaxID=2795124 RepID=UPI001E2EDA91|nr:sensor histidine kinase [Ralstonia sp. ASV6]